MKDYLLLAGGFAMISVAPAYYFYDNVGGRVAPSLTTPAQAETSIPPSAETL